MFKFKLKSNFYEKVHMRFILIVALVLFIVFSIIVLCIIFSGSLSKNKTAVVQVIKADDRQIKIKPESRGGMNVPNRDRLIYHNMISQNDNRQQIERLLSPIEQPLELNEQYKLSIDPKLIVTSSDKSIAKSITNANTDVTNTLSNKVIKAANDWTVQLGSLKTEEDAKNEWLRIKKFNKDVLGSFDGNIVRIMFANNEIFWRIRIGPMTEEQARNICDNLSKRSQVCFFVKK